MSYFKKYKFDKSQFKLGMRTFKTGIAVFLVLLIFGFFGWKGLQIGALTAVFSLRESFDKSVHFGTSRILGNSIGGLYALVFFLLNTFFHEAFWVTLVVVPICTMLTIMTNVAMNNKAGVIGGVAANHYPIDSYWRNDFVRVCACIRNVYGSFCCNSRKLRY